MAVKIGVRDLKNRASEIVRDVHEQDAQYIVTLRGEPVAVLQPLSDKSERELRQAERAEALAKLDVLAEQIAKAWRSPKSAAELVDEQRR
ncbi:MAG TPA: type II toxin-antitoxin system prevent-host-death family antitoxin [Thermoanaerobaculia bacterium]|jgi:prevent-host-death family protein|nr:type II toxin-antitoxin system prevent-host-death family antitoxin [Thermoanaerobaculia bacterium]